MESILTLQRFFRSFLLKGWFTYELINSRLKFLIIAVSSEKELKEETSAHFTYNADHKNFNLEFSKLQLLRQQIVNLETSTPYTTYGDDHRNFILELFQLQLL